jgi:hypothetical protein
MGSQRRISPFLYNAAVVPPATSGVGVNSEINFVMSTEEGLAATTDPAVLIRHLDKVLCNGTMTEAFKTSLRSAIRAEVPTSTTAANIMERVNGAMMTVMNSPFYLIRF